MKMTFDQTQFRMRSGPAFVANQMSIVAAKAIISAGKKVETTTIVEGFPVTVDDRYFFPDALKPADPVAQKRRGNDGGEAT